ncbi:MAG: cytochrome b N-terminal domain-containing protein [Leptonema sp. (in: bacteria)]
MNQIIQTQSEEKRIKSVELKPERVRFFEPVLTLIKYFFFKINFVLYLGFTKDLNPMKHVGAIANFLFGIAIISGIILLFWYKPSVYQAYDSLEQLKQKEFFSFLGQLFRSLHRYSSDGTILFILIHMFKEIADRKVGGPRWLAWITGFLALGFMWFEGWSGYWLVWDVRAQQIALGTSKMIDLIPIFADPLSRTFLTDKHINTLLFFLIFFFHMLVPLLIILALWLHINRLNRSQWITNKMFSIIIMISLIAISVIKPAHSEAPAKMQMIPSSFTIDYWYLFPLWFTDRLNGGILWLISLLATIFVFGFPWIFYKQRFNPSVVDEDRCQNCQQCFIDCPYNAISMIPRENREPTARVNPKLCVSCGICNGSCLPVSVGIPYYQVLEKRRQYQKWRQESSQENKPFYIAFICANSIANNIEFDMQTGKTKNSLLKEFYVTAVPCLGWIHSRTLEALLSYEKSGALIIGCSECSYREGNKWLEERIFENRDPELRKEKVSLEKIKIIYPNTKYQLRKEIQNFKKELENNQIKNMLYNKTQPHKLWIAASIVILFLSLLTILISDLPYQTPFDSKPSLIVSFKHPGQISENCKELSQEELNKLPLHMRKKEVCERKRTPVKMALFINDDKILEKSYKPGGIWEDLNSIAIEEIPLEQGKYKIKVLISDLPNGEWNFNFEEVIFFEEWKKRVILFDKQGFELY